MKILHTSDWHLGRTLYTKKDRQAEHRAFFEWLLHTISENEINLLLVAGDIFDTTTPSSTAQKMYYDFLVKVKNTGCSHVVVVGGNHDSPSFLNAPKDVLAALDVAVIGNASEDIEDEIIVINDTENNPQLIVCGVPFLRERDISRFTEGENYSDRSKRINGSIKKHYEDIAALAVQKREEIGRHIPIIATGHLSVAEGKRNEDDGVKETYIGNIEAVGGNIFPTVFDYVALGHYHIPSLILENIRYCGSPIPMGFGEAEQIKCVYVINFTAKMSIETINIPVFQQLESIVGDKVFIENRLTALKNSGKSVWIEINYDGQDIFPELRKWSEEQVYNSSIEILKSNNRQYQVQNTVETTIAASLDEQSPEDVFNTFLEKIDVSDDQKEELKITYKEIVDEIGNEHE
jgi:DNA repair protein SbcD/Mre11